MRKLHSLVTEAVAACLARTDGVVPAEVLEHLESTQPEEIAQHYKALARQGLLRQIRDALRDTALDDGVETGEPTQLPLPGYKAPTTLPVLQPSGEFRYILFGKMTAKDFLQALETRKAGIVHDNKRLRDLEEKWRILRPYMLRNETITVGEAIQLLMQDNHSASFQE